MAKKQDESKDKQIRLLVDCSEGRCGEVVTLPVDDAKKLVSEGIADDNQSAIEYVLGNK